ncbi:MAG: DNA alkylation repair protein, partial [Firmicutes bacterium]|nr:DNA alkylation repair protein [Bacillota bacterium]
MNLNLNRWTQADYLKFYEYLTSLADAKYKKFTDSLVPGGGASLGVRVPALRAAAKEIAKGNYAEFLNCEMGDTREEILICGFVMSYIKCADYSALISYIKRYADMITSWETCDLAAFNAIKRYRTEFFADIEYFIYNENPWVVRFGFGCLMRYYLTDDYIDRVLEYVASVDSDFYYLQMMQAWL